MRRLLMSRPAYASSTSDNAACNTTSDFCGKVDRLPVERLAPRRISAGSKRAEIHAGATPNTTPVKSESKKAKPMTTSEGAVWMGTKFAPRKAISKSFLGGAAITSEPVQQLPGMAVTKPTAGEIVNDEIPDHSMPKEAKGVKKDFKRPASMPTDPDDRLPEDWD